jgi:opacity protein-like surface antigen
MGASPCMDANRYEMDPLSILMSSIYFSGKISKMKINYKSFAIILLFSAAVSPAMAENFYGAIDIGQTTGKDICAGLPPGAGGCEDTATLYRFAVGHQFSPMWGAEASYANYGKGSLGGLSGDWEATGLQISGTGTFPVGGKFSIIGKLGIASTDLKVTSNIPSSDSATSSKLAYGIGAQYDFTEKISGRAQYDDLGTVGDNNTTGTSKVTLLSAGLVLKF